MPSELARDRDRDDRAALPALLERTPTRVQTTGATIGLSTDRRGLSLPAARKLRALAQWSPLLPSRLDEQPSRVRVAGLGDRTEAAALAA